MSTVTSFIINNQRDAALSSLIYYSLRDHSTCFGCSLHPSSAVHKTVDSITGTSRVSVWFRLKSVEGVQGRAPSSLRHGPEMQSQVQVMCRCGVGLNL